MYTVNVTYVKNRCSGTVNFCSNSKNREDALRWAKTVFERTHGHECKAINYVIQERSANGHKSLVFID